MNDGRNKLLLYYLTASIKMVPREIERNGNLENLSLDNHQD